MYDLVALLWAAIGEFPARSCSPTSIIGGRSSYFRLQEPVLDHCCPRRDRTVAWSAENTRLGGTSVDYLGGGLRFEVLWPVQVIDRKSTRLNSSHLVISYA